MIVNKTNGFTFFCCLDICKGTLDKWAREVNDILVFWLFLIIFFVKSSLYLCCMALHSANEMALKSLIKCIDTFGEKIWGKNKYSGQ